MNIERGDTIEWELMSDRLHNMRPKIYKGVINGIEDNIITCNDGVIVHRQDMVYLNIITKRAYSKNRKDIET